MPKLEFAPPEELEITGMHQTDEGYWIAFISAGGIPIAVDNKFQSWRVVPTDPRGSYKEVLPEVAGALQDALPATARRGRKSV